LNKFQTPPVERAVDAEGKIMKKTIFILTTAALVLLSSRNANAGHREWAVAAGVWTGLAAASILTRVVEPSPVYYSANYFCAPAPVGRPVYVYPPSPVVCASPVPPRVVVYRSLLYVAPPVGVVRAPVCVSPPPVVAFRFGYGCQPMAARGGW
jgi:hypothetical protein